MYIKCVDPDKDWIDLTSTWLNQPNSSKQGGYFANNSKSNKKSRVITIMTNRAIMQLE